MIQNPCLRRLFLLLIKSEYFISNHLQYHQVRTIFQGGGKIETETEKTGVVDVVWVVLSTVTYEVCVKRTVAIVTKVVSCTV